MKWENLLLKPLDVGYNVAVAPNLLPKGASPKIENFMFKKGRLESDFGYATFGSTVRGLPRLLKQYNKKSGISEILLITNLTLYRWASNEWQYVAGDAATTADGGEPEYEVNLVVADITGFSDGDHMGVILDNGHQHQTTVNGTPSGYTIVMTDGVPAGRSVEDGASVVLACAFNGQDNRPVSAENYAAADACVITNGADNVKIYDGSTCEDMPNLATACGGSCYANIVKVKDSKIILYNTVEGGTDYPQRVRWCATGDHTDWTTASDAGFEDLYNSEDHIVAAEHMGPYVIIYRTTSIYRQEYVGSESLIYNFERTLTTYGAAGNHGVMVHGPMHSVMGSDGFFSYAGGYEQAEFGLEIWQKIYGPEGTINRTYQRNVFCLYLEALKRYYFMVPSDGSTQPSRIWVFDLLTKSWTSRVFADEILSMAEVELKGNTAWIDQTTKWNDAMWNIPWNDPSLRTGQSVLFMAGLKDGQNYVFEYSDDYTTDSGDTITCEFQTGELFYPGYKIRVDHVRVVGKGTLTAQYSNDEGESWTAYGTATCGSTYTAKEIHKQLVEERVMFRFTGSQVGLDTIQIFWKLESEN